mgnify:FL=1
MEVLNLIRYNMYNQHLLTQLVKQVAKPDTHDTKHCIIWQKTGRFNLA